MFSRINSARPSGLIALALGNFAVLGFHVGVQSVQLAPLSAALSLTPASLGLVITAAAIAGVFTLLAGGLLADRLGRRPVLLLGYGGTAVGFVLLATASTLPFLVAAMLVYGLFSSFIDLGSNTVGSDVESSIGRHVMTGLHSGFSAGATIGALATAVALTLGVDYRVVYLALAAVLAAMGVVTAVATMPVRAPEEAHEGGPDARGVWRIPAVLFAIALITVTFFGDGALESFLAVYLRDTLDSTILLTGGGVAAFHAASLAGRLVSSRILHRWGERRVVIAAGLLAAAGTTAAVLAPAPGVAVAGLLVVGFAVSPIVPVSLSLAGRSAPGRSGRAVATTTAIGYVSFIVSPSLVGGVATLTSLRLALGLVVLSTIGIAVLGSRWPKGR